MLTDALIDTNVLAHASNPGVTYHGPAKAFVVAFKDCTTMLCVDEGFDPRPERNRSLIVSEYLTQLQSGMLGFAVLAHLAQSMRVRPLSRRVSPSHARRIRLLNLKPRDVTFVKVSINSDECLYISHDFEDFPQDKRRTIRSDLGVEIIDAAVAITRL